MQNSEQLQMLIRSQNPCKSSGQLTGVAGGSAPSSMCKISHFKFFEHVNLGVSTAGNSVIANMVEDRL